MGDSGASSAPAGPEGSARRASSVNMFGAAGPIPFRAEQARESRIDAECAGELTVERQATWRSAWVGDIRLYDWECPCGGADEVGRPSERERAGLVQRHGAQGTAVVSARAVGAAFPVCNQGL